MIAWLIVALYALGWPVAAVGAARHWFKRFGVEIGGAVWGMGVAFLWPLAALVALPAYAIKLVASRGLDRRGRAYGVWK